MSNERDVEFTPATGLEGGQGGVEFQPSAGLEMGASTGSSGTGTAGAAAAAGDAAQQAKDKVQQLASTAQQRAGEQLQSGLTAGKSRAAETLSGVAQSLRGSSQQFQGQPGGIDQYLGQAADRVERVARYLENRDIPALMDDVERFARRQPSVFLGGAFVLGMLGARFLKSSPRSLASEGLREHWDTRAMTERVRDPERDAVGRPQAPGYAPPSERASSDKDAAGPRT